MLCKFCGKELGNMKHGSGILCPHCYAINPIVPTGKAESRKGPAVGKDEVIDNED